MRRSIYLIAAFAALLLLTSSILMADVPGKMSYQGYLTNSGGDPLDTSVQVIFTIYDSTGVSKWSEEHSVSVSGGVFGVGLGSTTPIPDTVFNGEERYLGIKVGNDPEISPRTLLTSSPQTFISQRVNGDIETDSGLLVLKAGNGDSAVVLSAGDERGISSIYMIEPVNDNVHKIELATGSSGSYFNMFSLDPANYGNNVFELSTLPSGVTKLDMFNPGEQSGGLVQMGVDPAKGGFLEIHAAEPALARAVRLTGTPADTGIITLFGGPHGADYRLLELRSHTNDGGNISFYNADGDELLEISGSPSSGGGFRMFNPQPEPPAVLLEMIANATDGASINIYDDIGQVMGLEPTPFNEAFSMYLMDPVDEYNLFELTGNYITDEVNMYLMDPVDKRDLLTLSGSHSAGGSIKMFNPQPEPPKIILEMQTNSSGGPSIYMATPVPEPPPKVIEMSIEEVIGDDTEWAGFFNMFSMDPGDNGREILEISTAASTGASLRMFNPQPEPPAVLLDINANATDGARIDFFDNIGQIAGFEPTPFNSGFGLKMFNPQPEPPAVLLDINSSYGTKGGTAEVAVYDDSEDLESHLTPGKLLLNTTPGPTVGPPIILEVTGTDAKVGIGTDSPSEPLVVGDDLTYFAGNLITVGDASPTSYAGISFGQDADNRGWMIYDNAGDYIYFGTKEDGVFAPNSIYMKGGDLGIGTDSPDADLHVVGNICYTGSIDVCSDARYKKDVSTLSSALDKVSRLRGVSFNWRRDEFPQNGFSDREQVGLIAQEVEEVFPQVVSQTKDGYYNVDYTKLTPLLVEAIKELKTQNEELKSTNEELIRRIEKLEGEKR